MRANLPGRYRRPYRQQWLAVWYWTVRQPRFGCRVSHFEYWRRQLCSLFRGLCDADDAGVIELRERQPRLRRARRQLPRRPSSRTLQPRALGRRTAGPCRAYDAWPPQNEDADRRPARIIFRWIRAMAAGAFAFAGYPTPRHRRRTQLDRMAGPDPNVTTWSGG